MEFFARVIGVIAATAISKGVLLWLGSQHQIYPEQWVARLIGIAESGVTSYPAISWIIAGLIGLVGIFVGPVVLSWGVKTFGQVPPPEQLWPANVASQRLNDWRAGENTIRTLSGLTNKHSNVKIVYFDNRNFPFAERLAAAFKLAGWAVNFNKTAQGNYNPHYVKGVEVKGDNRILVESISGTLKGTGCSDVREVVSATTIPPGHIKYDLAQNKIYLTIGYEE
jgi:hypothetical protein